MNFSLDSVVFPKNETQSQNIREMVDRILDGLDEASLQFILRVLEAMREKERQGRA